MTRRQRRAYTIEQKADAVRLVQETGSVSKVAKDLDLTQSSLRQWVRHPATVTWHPATATRICANGVPKRQRRVRS